jgi:hypothetical protein
MKAAGSWLLFTVLTMMFALTTALIVNASPANSWITIITNNTSFGYGYSITSYNGLIYIYYTELMPSGVAVVRGLVFNGTTAVKAPLPVFNDLGEASPLLVMLGNGSLMMIWGGVPMGHYGLNNLTILLQASVLHGDTWGPVVNLTTSGDAMSYASDGEYVYLVYEPKLTLTYNNTILEELTPSGRVVKALSIPGIIGITSAWNGLVVVQFLNGTQALVNMNNGSATQIPLTLMMGFTGNGLTYYFNTNSKILTIINGSRVVANLKLPSPWYNHAYPLQWGSGFIIIAWGPVFPTAGLLSAFYWNSVSLITLANYTLKTSFIVPGVAIAGHYLYLAWQMLENLENGTSSIYLAVIPLTTPSQVTHTVTTTTAVKTITTTATVTSTTVTTVTSTVTSTVMETSTTTTTTTSTVESTSVVTSTTTSTSVLTLTTISTMMVIESLSSAALAGSIVAVVVIAAAIVLILLRRR